MQVMQVWVTVRANIVILVFRWKKNSKLEEVGLEDNLTHGQLGSQQFVKISYSFSFSLPTQTICYIYTECNVSSRYFLVSGLFLRVSESV